MSAGVYNFTVEQGVTFRRQITLYDSNNDPINLTGFSARMQIRPEVESDEVIVYLTTANGGLTTNASGVVQIFMAASTTAAIDRDGVYDIEIVANGNGEVTRPLKGKVRLDPEVTR